MTVVVVVVMVVVVLVVVVRYNNSYLFCYVPKSVYDSNKFIIEIRFNSFECFYFGHGVV
jgi:hypothetical protein